MKFIIAALTSLSLLLTSCLGIAPTQEVREIDRLNHKASLFWYVSLDSVAEFAGLAYKNTKYYELGKAEAANNLGFYKFMQMDFQRAMQYYQEISEYTNNELELLISDIGMMKVFQRTARSKQFYDYRNSALARMKRINEDRSVFDTEKDLDRLLYAHSEFYIVSAIYFYYLQQDHEAGIALDDITFLSDLSFSSLTHGIKLNQYLYYQYVKGSTKLVSGNSYEKKILHSFDILYQTWIAAREYGIDYFEGNAAQSMADMMASHANYALLKRDRGHLLASFGVIDSLLPLRLGESALALFQSYKDIYQIAGAYVTIGKYYNYHQLYNKALEALTKALDVVNKHHKTYYPDHHNTPDDLVLYDKDDAGDYTEINWIKDDVFTVPEWIARIREQLSVAYAGLNNKEASDYNRNIYLDILDLVRQDKEAESRFESLKQEEKFINTLLFLLFFVILCLSIIFIWLNKHAKRKTQAYFVRLEKSLLTCRELTASLPQKDDDVEAIFKPIVSIIEQFLVETTNVERILMRVQLKGEEFETIYDSAPSLANKELVHVNFNLKTEDSSISDGFFRVYTRKALSKEDISFINILSPYVVWAIENGLHYMDLGEERAILDKKLFITNQHNIQHKRENIMKRACMRVVYGIQPYLDRVRNELDKIVHADYAQYQEVRTYKYKYIEELLTTIQEHNEVLALWINIKQGELSLQITNFNLGDLLKLLQKSTRSFEQKGIELRVEPRDLYVKADEALTLFMLNTLLENARKFTPSGGRVEVIMQEEADYVEVSVVDTGLGISPEDISTLLNEKVYDSNAIGEGNPVVMENKGSGFGLINCKAIIDKYQKTNPIFKVCDFSIESTVNKGSRFSFRLPYGLKKSLLVALLLISNLFTVDARVTNTIDWEENLDTLTTGYSYLKEASDYADAAYFSNKEHKYKLSLDYIARAITALNNYYEDQNDDNYPLMSLVDYNIPAEIGWWDREFATSYNVILDIRNEASIAFLALKNIDGYNYNNVAYTMLYKSLTKDDSLDRFCKILERSTSNKRIVLIILLLLVVSAIVVYYMAYVRQRYLRRWSLEQVLDINQIIFSSSLKYTTSLDDSPIEEIDFTTIPQEILSNSFSKINDLLAVEQLSLVLYDREKQRFFTTSYPEQIELDKTNLSTCLESQEWIHEGNEYYIPLEVVVGEISQRVGIFYIKLREVRTAKEEKILVEFIVRYLSTVLYNTMIRTAGRLRDINLVFDDIHRLEWENNQIHVQNRVLDNCLSAIKHETIYYPSRLKQLVEQLLSDNISTEDEQSQIRGMYDLVEYYKGVFTILSLWAKKELEQATFRRSTLEVDQLVDSLQKCFQRKSKHRVNQLTLTWKVEPGLELVGDDKLIVYLFELLFSDAIALDESGNVEIEISADKHFINFTYHDNRVHYSPEQLNNLFYPVITSMKGSSVGGLSGLTCLIAKEIIREHDEFVGRRGCRINVYDDEGVKLVFSLPRKLKIENEI